MKLTSFIILLTSSYLSSPSSGCIYPRRSLVKKQGTVTVNSKFRSSELGVNLHGELDSAQIQDGFTFWRNLDSSSVNWDYNPESGHGPDEWGELFDTCAGMEQSPIDIPGSEEFTERAFLPTFAFDYNFGVDEVTVEFENLGTTVEAIFDFDNPAAHQRFNLSGVEVLPYLAGRSDSFREEDNMFTLAQFHFHWGKMDSVGSEHLVNGKQFPLEMHLVHFNSAKYTSVAQAAAHADGIMVVAVFFDVENADSTTDFLSPFADTLSDANFTDGKHEEVEFALQNFVDDLYDDDGNLNYYLYGGSLTTPTCNQAVTWAVMQKVMFISEEVLAAFQGVSGSTSSETLLNEIAGEEGKGNFRPTQTIGERRVFDSYLQKVTQLSGKNSATANLVQAKTIAFAFGALLCSFFLF